MAQQYFNTQIHSALYSQFRPSPPLDLVERIMNFLKQKCIEPLQIAVDVGCGNGQNTELLAPYFQKVYGTDVSKSQIAEAVKRNQHSNIAFQIALAENIPCPDQSVHLVTASQAAHWFDLDKFYAEVDKKLVPNGVLAIFGYSFPEIDISEKKKELFDACNQVYSVDTKGYWGPGREAVDNEYKDILIPYEGRLREYYYLKLQWSLARFSNYITTWSGYQNMMRAEGEEKARSVILAFENRVKEILGDPRDSAAIELPISVKYFLLMGRKPAA